MMTDDVCGIYLITNTINGHMYVGQSIDIHKRWREHCALKDSHSSLVEKAIAKYGVENFSFEIIITLENDTDKLNDAEREWIAILNTYEDKNHYNQTPGGDFSPMKVPEIAAKISGENNPMKNLEARAKISGENNPFYGRKHTPEAKEKISTANSGKKLSEDTRKKCLKLEIRLVIIVLPRRKVLNTDRVFVIFTDIAMMMENVMQSAALILKN